MLIAERQNSTAAQELISTYMKKNNISFDEVDSESNTIEVPISASSNTLDRIINFAMTGKNTVKNSALSSGNELNSLMNLYSLLGTGRAGVPEIKNDLKILPSKSSKNNKPN